MWSIVTPMRNLLRKPSKRGEGDLFGERKLSKDSLDEGNFILTSSPNFTPNCKNNTFSEQGTPAEIEKNIETPTSCKKQVVERRESTRLQNASKFLRGLRSNSNNQSGSPKIPNSQSEGSNITKNSSSQSESSTLPKSPNSQSGGSFFPNNSNSQSGGSFLPNTNNSQSGGSILPNSPNSQSGGSVLPNTNNIQSGGSFLPNSNNSQSGGFFLKNTPNSQSGGSFLSNTNNSQSGGSISLRSHSSQSEASKNSKNHVNQSGGTLTPKTSKNNQSGGSSKNFSANQHPERSQSFIEKRRELNYKVPSKNSSKGGSKKQNRTQSFLSQNEAKSPYVNVSEISNRKAGSNKERIYENFEIICERAGILRPENSNRKIYETPQQGGSADYVNIENLQKVTHFSSKYENSPEIMGQKYRNQTVAKNGPVNENPRKLRRSASEVPIERMVKTPARVGLSIWQSSSTENSSPTQKSPKNPQLFSNSTPQSQKQLPNNYKSSTNQGPVSQNLNNSFHSSNKYNSSHNLQNLQNSQTSNFYQISSTLPRSFSISQPSQPIREKSNPSKLISSSTSNLFDKKSNPALSLSPQKKISARRSNYNCISFDGAFLTEEPHEESKMINLWASQSSENVLNLHPNVLNYKNPNSSPPERDSSNIKNVRYGAGHEKYPSWPIPAQNISEVDPGNCEKLESGGSARSKSWAEGTENIKEKSGGYTRPYMKKMSGAYTQQLKTVLENGNNSNGAPSGAFEYLEKHHPSPPEHDTVVDDLELYAKKYEERLLPHNYAASEGYHSYISSSSSSSYISTPFLDLLRKEGDLPSNNPSSNHSNHNNCGNLGNCGNLNNIGNCGNLSNCGNLGNCGNMSNCGNLSGGGQHWGDGVCYGYGSWEGGGGRESVATVVTNSSGSSSGVAESIGSSWGEGLSGPGTSTNSRIWEQKLQESIELATAEFPPPPPLHLLKEKSGSSDETSPTNLKKFPVSTYTRPSHLSLNDPSKKITPPKTQKSPIIDTSKPPSVAQRILQLELEQKSKNYPPLNTSPSLRELNTAQNSNNTSHFTKSYSLSNLGKAQPQSPLQKNNQLGVKGGESSKNSPGSQGLSEGDKFTYFDPEKKHKVADMTLKEIQKKALLAYYERHTKRNGSSSSGDDESTSQQHSPPFKNNSQNNSSSNSPHSHAEDESHIVPSLFSSHKNLPQNHELTNSNNSPNNMSQPQEILQNSLLPPERPPKKPHLRAKESFESSVPPPPLPRAPIKSSKNPTPPLPLKPKTKKMARCPSPELLPPPPPTNEDLGESIGNLDGPLPPPPPSLREIGHRGSFNGEKMVKIEQKYLRVNSSPGTNGVLDSGLSPSAWEKYHNIRPTSTTLIFTSNELPIGTASQTGSPLDESHNFQKSISTNVPQVTESNCYNNKTGLSQPPILPIGKVAPLRGVPFRVNYSKTDACSQTETEISKSGPEEDEKYDKNERVDRGDKSEMNGERDTNGEYCGRRKSKEEIECERLERDLAEQLPVGDKLQNLLVNAPTHKTSSHYITGIFDKAGADKNNEERLVDEKEEELRKEIKKELKIAQSPLPADSAYFTTSECKAKLLTQFSYSSDKLHSNGPELNKQKEELVSRISRKLEILRFEASDIRDEIGSNESLGSSVLTRVQQTATRTEFHKFKLHVEEIERITSLLLGLSGRLARAENAIMGLSESPQEKKILESKRDRLREQLDEAKILKESIDRRSAQVSGFLEKYLTAEEFADYHHFTKMKAKLIIDSREIDEKIKLGEEQLHALQETLKLK